MKKLILSILFLIPFLTRAQDSSPTIGQVFNTISAMKAQKGSDNAVAYVIGGANLTDFRGAFYVYDSSSVLSEDMVSYNVIAVTGVPTGRWIRSNQTSQVLPQGTLFRIGPLKILAASGSTNGNGEFVLNATTDNTATGTAIFSNILFNSTQATSSATNVNDIPSGSVKSVVNNKVITYRYSKGTVVALLNVATVVIAGSGVAVQCFVVGI